MLIMASAFGLFVALVNSKSAPEVRRWKVRVDDCDYIEYKTGSGETRLIHAGDCPNPLHRLQPPAAPPAETDP